MHIGYMTMIFGATTAVLADEGYTPGEIHDMVDQALKARDKRDSPEMAGVAETIAAALEDIVK